MILKTVKYRYKDASGDYTYETFDLPDDAEEFVNIDSNGREIFNGDYLVDEDNRLYRAEKILMVEWLPTNCCKDMSKYVRRSPWEFRMTADGKHTLTYKEIRRA